MSVGGGGALRKEQRVGARAGVGRPRRRVGPVRKALCVRRRERLVVAPEQVRSRQLLFQNALPSPRVGRPLLVVVRGKPLIVRAFCGFGVVVVVACGARALVRLAGAEAAQLFVGDAAGGARLLRAQRRGGVGRRAGLALPTNHIRRRELHLDDALPEPSLGVVRVGVVLLLAVVVAVVGARVVFARVVFARVVVARLGRVACRPGTRAVDVVLCLEVSCEDALRVVRGGGAVVRRVQRSHLGHAPRVARSDGL
mmetsp:Transcript_8425/g.28998  ORF Transcript_8425/g.28998 Transcript_8425/m.28998 type:complete len:254 (+) Transcript_8425:968-1729(+)